VQFGLKMCVAARNHEKFTKPLILGVQSRSRLKLKSIKIDTEKLHLKFSALNVDFDGLSLDFLGSRKPAHEGIKEHYASLPSKSRYFSVVGQSFVKTVADRHGYCEVVLGGV